MTASMSSSIRWPPPRRSARPKSNWSRATTRFWRPARPTMPAMCCSRRAWRAARAACRRRLLTVTSEKADYAFLSLKTSAFDLTDRGVAGREIARRRRRLRLCRARRLPLQRDRLSDRAAARRAGQRHDRRAADAGDRAAGRRRIPPGPACRIRARAAAPWRWRSIPRSRPGPGGRGPIPTPRELRSAKPPSWSRITSPSGSNSTLPPRTS